MTKLIVQAFLIVILLALVAAGGTTYWAWTGLNTPEPHSLTGEIEIPAGFSPDAAIARLTENGIIKQSLPLRIYMKLTGEGKLIKAGAYKFGSPISPIQALRKLETGGEALGKVTVIEGWSRWDIATALARTPRLNFTDSAQALALLNDTAEIKDIAPKATSLEGFLYPDTYFIDAHTTQKGLVSQMVSRFRQVWKGKLADRAKEAGLSAQQVVTVASLIETEAKLEGDRPIVSSVIYNRLKKGIPLALDSTIVYASKQAGKWRNDGKVYQSDIDRKSPYNTRQVTGLPPGPIGAPGFSCLQAALHPANTDYIYYVRNPARNDGAHNFYSDAATFEKGVQALRDWERDRDSRATASHPATTPTTPQVPKQSTIGVQPPPSAPAIINHPPALHHSAPTPPIKVPTTSKSKQSTPRKNGGRKIIVSKNKAAKSATAKKSPRKSAPPPGKAKHGKKKH